VLLVFTAPEATIPVPLMSHCALHAPLSQMSPVPQLVPLDVRVHAVLLAPGLQVSHPLFAEKPEV
jgi:hypothetical protein